MRDWEIGVIVGSSVLSIIIIALLIRYCCKNRREGGESKPLLHDQKTSSTAAALNFAAQIPVDPPTAGGPGEFLDSNAARRIAGWIDDVERARRGDGLQPLQPPQAESVQLLGDTPDFAGVVTPRTPNSLSPRISGVDDVSSTGGVLGGYSANRGGAGGGAVGGAVN
jgi:hypothetical protein